jgi:hypothetical protein
MKEEVIMAATILPDHILGAVLVLAEKKYNEHGELNRLAFRGHDFELQQIFSDLRETGKYGILDAFVFSDSGPDPYSPVLNESVSRLQLSGLIGRENPDYEVVFVRPAAERFFNDVLTKELNSSQISQLTEVASEFLERVTTVSNPA